MSTNTEPISWHVLPVALIVDLVIAYNVQHVIDCTPSCLNLAGTLAEHGVSYVGICGTQKQSDWLKAQADAYILDRLKDHTSRLFDKRLISSPPPVSADEPPVAHAAADNAGNEDATVKTKKAKGKPTAGAAGGAADPTQLNLQKLLEEARASAGNVVAVDDGEGDGGADGK